MEGAAIADEARMNSGLAMKVGDTQEATKDPSKGRPQESVLQLPCRVFSVVPLTMTALEMLPRMNLPLLAFAAHCKTHLFNQDFI